MFAGLLLPGLCCLHTRLPRLTRPRLPPLPLRPPQVEDIVDSGRTAVALLEHFKAMGAASVALVSLLSKPARRTVPCEPDFLCFEVVSAGRQASAAPCWLACPFTGAKQRGACRPRRAARRRVRQPAPAARPLAPLRSSPLLHLLPARPAPHRRTSLWSATAWTLMSSTARCPMWGCCAQRATRQPSDSLRRRPTRSACPAQAAAP